MHFLSVDLCGSFIYIICLFSITPFLGTISFSENICIEFWTVGFCRNKFSWKKSSSTLMVLCAFKNYRFKTADNELPPNDCFLKLGSETCLTLDSVKFFSFLSLSYPLIVYFFISGYLYFSFLLSSITASLFMPLRNSCQCILILIFYILGPKWIKAFYLNYLVLLLKYTYTQFKILVVLK